VTDAETGASILFASISVYKNDMLIIEAETDLDGKYSILNLQPDIYNIKQAL
jgi:hypothetical protein